MVACVGCIVQKKVKAKAKKKIASTQPPEKTPEPPLHRVHGDAHHGRVGKGGEDESPSSPSSVPCLSLSLPCPCPWSVPPSKRPSLNKREKKKEISSSDRLRLPWPLLLLPSPPTPTAMQFIRWGMMTKTLVVLLVLRRRCRPLFTLFYPLFTIYHRLRTPRPGGLPRRVPTTTTAATAAASSSVCPA